MGLSEVLRHEWASADAAMRANDHARAFAHYERVHVIGQRLTSWHVRSHLGMLRIGWRRRDWREVLGQLSRIPAAALFSKLWVPLGNTGGANVSAFRPMPIPPDIAALLESERAET